MPRHLNTYDKVITDPAPDRAGLEWITFEDVELYFRHMTARKRHPIQPLHHKHSQKVEHVIFHKTASVYTERQLVGNILPHPAGKKSFARPFGLCDVRGSVLLLMKLISKGKDFTPKATISHAAAIDGSAVAGLARGDSGWTSARGHASLAKIGRVDHAPEIDRVLYQALADKIDEEEDDYFSRNWTYPIDRAPAYVDVMTNQAVPQADQTHPLYQQVQMMLKPIRPVDHGNENRSCNRPAPVTMTHRHSPTATTSPRISKIAL